MLLRSSFSCVFAALLMIVTFGCQFEKREPEENYLTWEVYKGDATSSSYSALDQINKYNVHQLKKAWIYRTGDLTEDHPRTGMETNPIVIDDILYAISPHMKIFAVDAASGEEKWIFDPFVGERSTWKLRALTYWESGPDKRILFTAGTWLYALDAETGNQIMDFGKEGRIDSRLGLGRDPNTISVMASSPGIIYKDLLIMGSAVTEQREAAPGHIRAYDVRTGEIVWKYKTIPDKGEPGFETWEYMDEAALSLRGGTNNWAGMSLDVNRGIVYIPLGSPVYDWYGGDRTGKNLYSNSLLALDAATGEYIWHYQIVHHDLWDYDLPAPPNLLTLEREGKQVDAVAQITKHGFVFVFNRVTGESLFPIEERRVPASDISSEAVWPTQPFPLKPKPFSRQEITEENVTDLSPGAREFVLTELSKYRNEGLFTPGDPRGSVMMPGTTGAGRWGGAAHDPSTGILYINSSELPSVLTVQRESVDKTTTPGEMFYTHNCSSCHGIDREGQPPDFPSLANIGSSKTEEEILEIVVGGGSMMPSFENITETEKKVLIDYLLNQSADQGMSETEHSLQNDSAHDQYIGVNPHRRLEDPDGYPAIKPPWGTLNAIDLNTGDYVWSIPLGSYPELEEKGIPPTGMPSMGGPIVTRGGLIFIAGTEDKQIRAFDKDSGELLWESKLPAAGFATPATYMSNGRQYLVIAAGGGRGTDPGDYYIAYTLPE